MVDSFVENQSQIQHSKTQTVMNNEKSSIFLHIIMEYSENGDVYQVGFIIFICKTSNTSAF